MWGIDGLTVYPNLFDVGTRLRLVVGVMFRPSLWRRAVHHMVAAVVHSPCTEWWPADRRAQVVGVTPAIPMPQDFYPLVKLPVGDQRWPDAALVATLVAIGLGNSPAGVERVLEDLEQLRRGGAGCAGLRVLPYSGLARFPRVPSVVQLLADLQMSVYWPLSSRSQASRRTLGAGAGRA